MPTRRNFLKLSLLLFVCITAFQGSYAQVSTKKENWRSLFNGKDLSGWETYLDAPYAANSSQKLPPLGLNNDPGHVFSVVTEDGQPAMRISGETFGGINTLEEFENYHLRLEFKWGTKKWPPKLDQPRDSGLLYHSTGNHGTPMLWMESFEYQIQEGDTGDYWGVMDVLADITAKKNGQGKYVYSAGSSPLVFQDKTTNGRTCLKSTDNEKASGQWNTVDLYCFNGTCVHVINGKVNNVLTNTRHVVDGKVLPLNKGSIQIQSEGAEVFYRNIAVTGISSLPQNLVP
ncbi:protein of unknown function [Dyadobacter sp. SG02]|uniref:3-keto-disaccharide hydrolase n=1 Tax=Dyadobacter sp. SG02 TaxID=1855291 RepID=UPI0008C522C4|nr:DUF1080 domain-containing protein [Dyadobacter sp. SG02]SEI53312.1 protein of unknown function [Dyadobacter sp. SG02]